MTKCGWYGSFDDQTFVIGICIRETTVVILKRGHAIYILQPGSAPMKQSQIYNKNRTMVSRIRRNENISRTLSGIVVLLNIDYNEVGMPVTMITYILHGNSCLALHNTRTSHKSSKFVFSPIHYTIFQITHVKSDNLYIIIIVSSQCSQENRHSFNICHSL